jgi:antirestriction protein
MADNSLNDLAPSNNPSRVNNSGPRIYVICLAAYSNGWLHGKWLSATQEVHAIEKKIKEMLLTSPISEAKEFGIHAFEGFGSLKINGCENIESIQKKALLISELGELGSELLAYYGNVDFARSAWGNHYHGEHDNELEFAIQLFDRLYMAAIPEAAQAYIDYAFFRRDIFISDYFSLKVNERLHVFSR